MKQFAVIVSNKTGLYFKRMRNGARRWVALDDATFYKSAPTTTLWYMRQRGLSVSLEWVLSA